MKSWLQGEMEMIGDQEAVSTDCTGSSKRSDIDDSDAKRALTKITSDRN